MSPIIIHSCGGFQMYDGYDEAGVCWTRRRRKNVQTCTNNHGFMLMLALPLAGLVFLWWRFAVEPIDRYLQVSRRVVWTKCHVNRTLEVRTDPSEKCDLVLARGATDEQNAASYCVDLFVELDWSDDDLYGRRPSAKLWALVSRGRARVFPDPPGAWIAPLNLDTEFRQLAGRLVDCAVDPAVNATLAAVTGRGRPVYYPDGPFTVADGWICVLAVASSFLAAGVVSWMWLCCLMYIPGIACSCNCRRVRSLEALWCGISHQWFCVGHNTCSDCCCDLKVRGEDDNRPWVHPFLLGMHVRASSCATAPAPAPARPTALELFRQDALFAPRLLSLIDAFLDAEGGDKTLVQNDALRRQRVAHWRAFDAHETVLEPRAAPAAAAAVAEAPGGPASSRLEDLHVQIMHEPLTGETTWVEMSRGGTSGS